MKEGSNIIIIINMLSEIFLDLKLYYIIIIIINCVRTNRIISY